MYGYYGWLLQLLHLHLWCACWVIADCLQPQQQCCQLPAGQLQRPVVSQQVQSQQQLCLQLQQQPLLLGLLC
jgi:hypothetical protein